MTADRFQDAKRRVRAVAAVSFTKARTLDKAIEGLCVILAVAFAAKLTGNLGLFVDFINNHGRSVISTMLVYTLLIPLVYGIAGAANAFFRELFGWNSFQKDTPA